VIVQLEAVVQSCVGLRNIFAFSAGFEVNVADDDCDSPGEIDDDDRARHTRIRCGRANGF